MLSKSEIRLKDVFFTEKASIYLRVVKVVYNSNYLFMVSFKKDLTPLSLPEKYSIPVLLRRIEEKELILTDTDPCLKYVSLKNLSESQIKFMNRAWEKIKPIVSGKDDRLFNSNRYEMIKDMCSQTPKVSEPTLIQWLKKYYCGGMLKTALVANFKKCGAPGKNKSFRKISDALVELITIGFYKFYLNSESGEDTIQQARQNTIDYLWDTKVHGAIHFDYDTFRRYAVKAFPDAFENKVYRLGRKNAMRTSRMRHGTTGDIVTGAGILFQVDWTGLDVNLVTGFNRDIFLGKPILYCVVDSHSRLLVGILITFENPSWSTFMHAVYNAAINKVKFAARYNHPLNEGDWLGECVPQEIIADNGEAGGIKANELGEALGITLGNPESYIGDLKGICENMHKMIKLLINKNLTGAGLTNNKFSKRLGVDGRQEACLTLTELYQIGIEAAVLQNKLTMPKYPNNKDILSALVEKTPNAIWTWSISEGEGIQNPCNEIILFHEMIQKRMLTPSTKGFELYENQFFIPENEDDHKLLENLTNKSGGAGEQIIAYDSTYFHNKYWIYNDRMIRLKKLGEEEQEYENIYEMIAVVEYYRKERKDNLTRDDLAKIKASRNARAIINNAKEEQGGSTVQFKETDLAKSIVNESEKVRMLETALNTSQTVEEMKATRPDSTDELDDDYLMNQHSDELSAFDKRLKKI
jgi:hypothetical protein